MPGGLRRPPRLRPGDRVAVVATAGIVPSQRLAAGVSRLESWDLQVEVAKHVLDVDATLPYLAGADAEQLRQTLLAPAAGVDLFAGSQVECVVPGEASGQLRGGNLALLAADVGTAFGWPADGAVVVLEDLLETPYRIDRMLTQLLRSGWFDGVAGIVLGSFRECGDPEVVDAVLADRLRPLEVPIVKGLDFGHTSSTVTVPLGVRATLDAGRPALWLDEPPLR